MDINQSINDLKRLAESPDLVDSILEYKKEKDNPAEELVVKKLIDCPHEIVFTITAQALSQNEKGELIDTKDICIKNYHIPVPIDKDYNHYMSVFFNHLEKKILESISDSNQKALDNKDYQDE